MASNFPSSLDTFTNPSSSDAMDSVSVPHASQHSDLNDAVEALEAKVGADSSAVTSSLDYKVAQLEAISHGKILQVVSTTKTDTFTTTSSSYVDITGLSASITPSATSSKVLAVLTLGAVDHSAGPELILFDVTRGGTPVGVGAAAGSRTQAGIVLVNKGATRAESASWSYLDSPSTTSATTYQGRMQTPNATAYLNRTSADTDSASYGRSVCTLTLLEVSA
jgi:hypothetical protein